MVYSSDSTELGTIYQKSELQAIHDVCRELGLLLFLDGARLGSALTSPANDLTLADLWSVADVLPEMNDDKGVSAILVNTEKGQSLLTETGVSTTKLDQYAAVKNNGGFAGRIIMPERR